MSRKRRIFDIDMPDEAAPPATPAPPERKAAGPGAPEKAAGAGSETGSQAERRPAPEAEPAGPGPRIRSLDAGPPPRRGPMASAIAENAGALVERRDAEAAIRAENDALAHEYVALKRAGLVVRMVPLDAVLTEALVRDRKPGPDEDLGELVTSIRDVGLSNPIRVEERDDGRFELVQGWRRLNAFKALRDEAAAKGEDAAWDEIPAGILPRGEGVAALYRRMVDENVIRKDLSFAEMAEVAHHYAADPDTGPTDVEAAVAELFKSAGYQKRSYIRGFARLMALIGGHLAYPTELPRNLGLALLKRLEDDADAVAELRRELTGWDGRTIADELDLLRRHAGAGEAAAPAAGGRAAGKAGRRPRTTFEIERGGRRVKCTAGVGKLELRYDRDFTEIDRRKLEQGVARLLDSLG